MNSNQIITKKLNYKMHFSRTLSHYFLQSTSLFKTVIRTFPVCGWNNLNHDMGYSHTVSLFTIFIISLIIRPCLSLLTMSLH